MAIYIFLTVLLISSSIFVETAKTRLGDLITLCDMKSAKLNECVRDSANKLIPQLKNGLRDVDFPPLEPLKIPRMDIGQEQGSVYLKLELSDTVHTGLSGLRVNQANINMDNNAWTFNGVLPRYTLTGNYEGKGRILLLPLGGEGIANFTFNDLKIQLNIKTNKKMMAGNEHFDIKSATVLFEFTPGKNYLDVHRTKGDMTLAEHTRKFLMENADEVFSGLKKTLEEVYSDIFTGLLQRLFKKVPIKNLFKN